MIPVPKFKRPVALIIVAVIALVTVAIVANATQTLRVPNAARVSYNLAAGVNSAAIVPSPGVGVHLIGVCTTVGNRGVAHASVLVPSAAPQSVYWNGLDSFHTGAPPEI